MQHSTDMSFAGSALNSAVPSDAAVMVLRTLEASGLEAWIVGGWVRDALMGTSGHDIDICCSGSWGGERGGSARRGDLSNRVGHQIRGHHCRRRRRAH